MNQASSGKPPWTREADLVARQPRDMTGVDEIFTILMAMKWSPA